MNPALTIEPRTEDLFIRHLEGTLSKAEQHEFMLLVQQSPTLAQELKDIEGFDTFLGTAQLDTRDHDRIDTAFLLEMQTNLAQVVAIGTASIGASSGAVGASLASTKTVTTAATTQGAITAGATGTTAPAVIKGVSGMMSTLASAIGVKTALAVVAGFSVSYGVWRWGFSATETRVQSSSETVTPIHSSPSPNVTSQPSGGITNGASEQLPAANGASRTPQNSEQGHSINGVQTSPQQAESAAQTTVAKPVESSLPQSALPETTADSKPAETEPKTAEAKSHANITSLTPTQEKLRALIEDYSRQLKTKEQAGDRTTAAFLSKKIGMLYRETGNYEESAQMLEKALKTAQTLKLRELEGETLGELALLYRSTGNTDKALTTLREAVKILTESATANAEKWSKELQRMEKK